MARAFPSPLPKRERTARHAPGEGGGGSVTAAWEIGGGKEEGRFPSGLRTCMHGVGKGEVGAKPGHAGARHPEVKGGPSWHQETQRFWPASSALATSTRCGTPGH